MVTVTIHPVGKIGQWLLKRLGWAAWTSAWNTIYILPDRLNDPRLLRHEVEHVLQLQRDGRVTMMVRYLWWLCRHGYWNNPYEVEARAAEGLPLPPSIQIQPTKQYQPEER